MKKIQWKSVLCSLAVVLLTGCATGESRTQDTEEYAETESLKQAGLGAMAFLYDDAVWTYDEEMGNDSSLAFTMGDDSVLGVSCSRESFYQHPMDMISISRQICSAYTNYEEVQEPAVVAVQGEEWYEWIYKYEENGIEMMALQRLYGKNYYAYTMSYVAEKKAYDSNKNEALKVMNSAVMNVPDNTEAEEKAKKFLVGEWDLDASGYLVINDDGTYVWYMDDRKDEKNMHKGTYGCDVSNDALGFAEGEGVYLVLFPEALYMDGEEGQTANAKYDYAVSMEQQSDGTYQMINASTFSMYSMLKQD